MTAQKRQRSPNFPYIELRESVSLVTRLYKSDRLNLVPVETALTHMGLPPKSSTSQRSLSAMLEYGLLYDRGEGDAKQVAISDLGKTIILDNREDKVQQALQKSALNSQIMKKAVDEWGKGLPAEDTIKSILVMDWGFTERAAVRCSIVIKDNFIYAELEDSMKQESFGDPQTPPDDNKNKNLNEKKPEKPTGWMEFTVSLGTKKMACFLSEKITNDEFDFMIYWFQKMIRKDIVIDGENIKEIQEDDIPF